MMALAAPPTTLIPPIYFHILYLMHLRHQKTPLRTLKVAALVAIEPQRLNIATVI